MQAYFLWHKTEEKPIEHQSLKGAVFLRAKEKKKDKYRIKG